MLEATKINGDFSSSIFFFFAFGHFAVQWRWPDFVLLNLSQELLNLNIDIPGSMCCYNGSSIYEYDQQLILILLAILSPFTMPF